MTCSSAKRVVLVFCFRGWLVWVKEVVPASLSWDFIEEGGRTASLSCHGSVSGKVMAASVVGVQGERIQRIDIWCTEDSWHTNSWVFGKFLLLHQSPRLKMAVLDQGRIIAPWNQAFFRSFSTVTSGYLTELIEPTITSPNKAVSYPLELPISYYNGKLWCKKNPYISVTIHLRWVYMGFKLLGMNSSIR